MYQLVADPNMIKDALAQDAFYSLLIGSFYPIRDPEGGIPADPVYVIRSMQQYDVSYPEQHVFDLFEQALVTMSMDRHFNYLSLYYLFFYLSKTAKSVAELQPLVNEVASGISAYKAQLMQRYDPPGSKPDYSLWDDMVRLAGNAQENFNIELPGIN